MKPVISALALSLCLASVATAQNNPMVGGAPMLSSRNIIENAVNSADHTTLVAAVQAAGLVETLSGTGPFTVFAPTNAAFARLDQAALSQLLEPARVEQLTRILTCHVLPANAVTDVIAAMADEAGGTFKVTTLGGCVLEVTINAMGVTLSDQNGRLANVTVADVMQSNGVIHVVDRVILPAQ
jgi:transforming growth factor-beta-induced protein